MNLVLKTDVKKTEMALNKYKEANGDSIKANAALERNAAAALQSRQAYEKERGHLKRLAAQQEYEDDQLGETGTENTALTGSASRQSAASRPPSLSRNAKAGASKFSDEEGPVSDPSALVRGLRRIRAPPREKAYDPFMGMVTTRDYYELLANYPSIRLTKAKDDARTNVGGFDFQAYFDESLLRAFAGLGCFIDEERLGRDQPASRELPKVVAADSSEGGLSNEVF